ncbi:ribosome biogenesis GTPase YlqF [Fructobacillus sp. M1-13]|uniref:Ribosome biogenesis GTPase A n=1 Tax=Fructobacillus papyriferae TaxID=2713171 RepID=A0ABS5QNU5_9LACO|nr:ribosome biogenesis GTPase YlqF [Fructobacillus papyriferae]MBS9334721.1 ribosome biogenesis GTPase YlqF [Fructobacillus papyriferae]MCD2158711.1 ribosome biogenesis GTPase YlqF [Fructobacillus papyriferae]
MAQNIQWYPGHMAKAFRLMRENLSLVDLVFELVDARLPMSSRNPEVDKLIEKKPRLLVLTKADLADSKETASWKAYFEKQGLNVVVLDTRGPKTAQMMTKAAKEVLKDRIEAQETKGIKNRPIRVMLAGIPNVGKSTLLNHLVQKNVAITANKPGVTKKVAWLKTSTGLEILDSPGVLWPKFEDQKTGQRLALTGAVKDTIFAKDDAALYLLSFFREYNPQAIIDRYHLADDAFDQTDVNLLLTITEKLGFKDDYDKAAVRLLNDLRSGKLGRYTLDREHD